MRKFLALTMAFILCLGTVTINAEALLNNNITILYSNKNEIYSFKSDIINVDNYNYAKASELLNNLLIDDENITIAENLDSISFHNENYDVTFVNNSNIYIQNNISYKMSAIPFTYEDEIYLPIRYVANALGLLVKYDAGLEQVVVTDFKSKIPTVYKESELIQFSELTTDETIATLTTNYGNIVIRLFPEYAPLAVENFTEQAMSGYYDGVSFHRVINDFVIQGGDPTATGRTSESIFGEPYENEVTPYLRHFTGAVGVANSGADTNGSQFYIVNTGDKEINKTLSEQLEYYINNPLEINHGYINRELISPVTANKYLEVGGTPFLDFSYTVFGQVIEGMDIVYQISNVETDNDDKPIKNVIITKVSIKQYKN